MRPILLVTISLLAVVPLSAQSPSASMVGRVLDESGAVIPGVGIRITNLGANQSRDGIKGLRLPRT